MVARVTLAEIDTLRMSVPDAVEHFKERLLPPLQAQEGYAGLYVLATPEGRALVMSIWDSPEAAEAGLVSGFYDEQVAQFVTLFRSPPGREAYEVVIAEAPAVTSG